MSQPLRTPYPAGIGAATGRGTDMLPARADTLRARMFTEIAAADCTTEPGGLTYRRARDILQVHEVHGPRCRQWLAAAAYLSAGLDDE
ncbi:hypothetical protein IU449_02650 [Nocardia higoensis]|uniref:Uncharacterized protein n=1 Tax=Nocardia higoensis TaxID=228599 RepID=A0ABS0D545_9NOCA|nr:hypothetical protein [Nocardia higoensis]MBF6353456.1 hypothetical protein [Nocardia higoensis]